MLKTHSQIAMLRWAVRAEVGLAEPGCRVSFRVFELLSRCVFWHQFACGLHQPSHVGGAILDFVALKCLSVEISILMSPSLCIKQTHEHKWPF